MVVLKFGGTSVADVEAVRRVVAIIARERRPRVVVVSALAKVTDALLDLSRIAAAGHGAEAEARAAEIARRHLDMAGAITAAPRRAALEQLIGELAADLCTLVRGVVLVRDVSPALLDTIVAHGELLSSRIVAAMVEDAGTPATWLDAREVIVTGPEHGRAVPDFAATTERLRGVVLPAIACGKTVVLGGFIGRTPAGATTTLGRGGSDYSASIIGACLNADEIQIWTDVDGMLTADPRILPSAQPVADLSFDEASDLARFGAKVLHPATIEPAIDRDIPVSIRNSHRPFTPGTSITRSAGADRPAAAIASLDGLALVDVRATTLSKADREDRARSEGTNLPAAPGFAPIAEPDRRAPGRGTAFLSQVFAAFERAGLEPQVASCGERRVSVVVACDRGLEDALAALEPIAHVTVTRDIAMVAVVGQQRPGDQANIAGMFDALDGVPIQLVSRSWSGCHVAFAIPSALMRQAVALLHERLFGEASQAHEPTDATVDAPGLPGAVVLPWRSPRWSYRAVRTAGGAVVD